MNRRMKARMRKSRKNRPRNLKIALGFEVLLGAAMVWTVNTSPVAMGLMAYVFYRIIKADHQEWFPNG